MNIYFATYSFFGDPLICVSSECRELAKDFVVAGTTSESLYGACESMYKPDMVSVFSSKPYVT